MLGGKSILPLEASLPICEKRAWGRPGRSSSRVDHVEKHTCDNDPEVILLVALRYLFR